MSIPLHFDCVCCQARAAEPAIDPETATLVILSMCHNGDETIAGIVSELCFEHRRLLHRAGLHRAAEQETSR